MTRNTGQLSVPQPRIDLSIRDATMDDVAFIDALQKQHSRQVGFMHRKALESCIAGGDVLIAEEGTGHLAPGTREKSASASPKPNAKSLVPIASPLGYCIGRDKYFKREDVGIIYQLNVSPGRQRKLVGAALVQAMFEKAAWGCKLFCCWCAQDIEANHFWESIGFVPLAFRTGSERQSRIHIFWQKRIREGASDTPWWFPSQTSGGAIREDRLVLPIPPETHWSDAKPLVIPGVEALPGVEDEAKQLESKRSRRRAKVKLTPAQQSAAQRGGLWFATSADGAIRDRPPAANSRPEPRRYHPKYLTAARELCARYLEALQDDPTLIEPTGKYAPARTLAPGPAPAPGRKPGEPAAIAETRENVRLLDAA